MFDTYLYQLEKDHTFLAGYKECTLTGDRHPVFLFTSLRILRVISGCGEWKIGDRLCRLAKGDIIAVNNWEPRQFIRTFHTDLICEIFAFTPTVFGNEVACLSLFYNRSGSAFPLVGGNTPQGQELHRLLDMLKARLAKIPATVYDKIAVSCLITAAAACLLDSLPGATEVYLSQPDIKASSAKLVADAVIYLNRHLDQALSVSDLAKYAGVSREYFSRLFRRYTGITPVSFINLCKINRTLHRMTAEDRTVLDAALESGFTSASGFYKAFHALYGMSPTEYLSFRS